MKVSVVVAVYNPGPYIDDLIGSLRAQTLPAGEWEAVLVDDGSTDRTPALLDRVAAEAPNIRVIHAEHSGWPGRPRNLGIDAARGEYVFIADHDDRLAADALERLTSFADEHDSDVVIGTMVGVGRSVPKQIFGRTMVDAQERPDLLISSLTPQKLYRRALLNDRRIRFPEGVRRLEDHLFVVQAYLRARRVSIYADAPIYYFLLRPDGQNASRRRVEWGGYFENAAEAIAVVDAEAPDERTRVVMRRRWLRIEALRRVRGAAYLGRGNDRPGLVAAVRRLLAEQYPLAEIDLLTVFDRVAARLVLDGRDDDLAAFAAWEATVRVRPQVSAARLDPETGALVVEIATVQRATLDRPAVLADPPPGYPSPLEIASMERLPPQARIVVSLRRGTSVTGSTTQQVVDGVLRSTTRIPLGELEDGTWTLRTRFTGLERIPDDPVTAAGAELDAAAPIGGRPARLAGDQGRLLVHMGRDPSFATRLAGGIRRRLRRFGVSPSEA